MFHHPREYVDKREGLRLAGEELTRLVNKYFDENYKTMSDELLTFGIPAEEVTTMIRRVKYKLQVELIKDFTAELKTTVEQRGVQSKP